MNAFELRIPPPMVVITAAIAMWFLAALPPFAQVFPVVRMVAVVGMAVAGVAFSLSGVMAFRRAKTTVNPLKPGSASSLVSGGVYKITRNPMYVGMLFLLLAWAAFLWSPWPLIGVLGFAAFIGRFQIAPEERALLTLFGAEFTAYKARVRRWL